MSCKVEEFNISIGLFVGNIKGDRLKAMDIILSNELLLMQHLNYYLTVHNPFRPIEGFLIDIKVCVSYFHPLTHFIFILIPYLISLKDTMYTAKSRSFKNWH